MNSGQSILEESRKAGATGHCHHLSGRADCPQPAASHRGNSIGAVGAPRPTGGSGWMHARKILLQNHH
jgi:hypothetical protein